MLLVMRCAEYNQGATRKPVTYEYMGPHFHVGRGGLAGTSHQVDAELDRPVRNTNT